MRTPSDETKTNRPSSALWENSRPYIGGSSSMGSSSVLSRNTAKPLTRLNQMEHRKKGKRLYLFSMAATDKEAIAVTVSFSQSRLSELPAETNPCWTRPAGRRASTDLNTENRHTISSTASGHRPAVCKTSRIQSPA